MAKHLCRKQRNVIEYLLNINKNFNYIGYSIDVDRTTIADEIKRNKFVKSPIYDKFDKEGIDKIAYKCDLLLNPPYTQSSYPFVL